MNKVIKVLIPVLLVLAIVLCSAWYLFIYDQDFTRDALLSGARYFEDNGKHTTAQWFYNMAYLQSSDNDAVAIELAEQYKDHNNYTKAEYTLYKAIQDGGGIDLYIALSKTYIEQDKLLDAANLLNNVTGQVKKQLEDMRPAMPTVSPEPGFYSQYISVNVTAESGTLYANTAGRYPSVKTDAYTEGFSLKEGENVIFAISVSDEGLVSPLAIYSYTIGGVIEELEFHDATLEALIRKELNAGENTVLYTNDLWNITELSVPAEVKDYTDLKHMSFLQSLTIRDGGINQISHLSGLSNLEHLDIQNTPISAEELEMIGTFTKLQTLTLNNCSLSTTAPLSGLTGLTYLDLSNNTIRDISALSEMSNLQELHLQRNALSGLDNIKNCTNLNKLDVSYNNITSIAPICSIENLEWLDVSHNSIASIAEIQTLSKLQHLYASYNQLTDISPVVGCKQLIDLSVGSNQLTDISSLSALNTIMFLDFSYNQVTTVPSWDKTCKLVTIDGSHNLLTSIDPLGGLEALNNVYMDYNAELSSIKALADCHRLIRVNVYGTKVKDVSALTDQSIIVNFDPT